MMDGGFDSKVDESSWRMFRSFFLALHGTSTLEFTPSQMFDNEMFMQATLTDFDVTVRELKVYTGTGKDEHEVTSEEEFYNERIQELRTAVVTVGLSEYLKMFPVLQGIPMSPFPKW
jgi:hypothetical protein